MKQRWSSYVSILSNIVIVAASITLFGYMLYYSALEWYIVGPLMYTAGDRASELVKDLRKIKDQ